MIAIDGAIAGKTLTNQTAGGQGFSSPTQNTARKRLARRLALTRLMVERKRAPSNRVLEIPTDDRFGCGQPSYAGSCTNGKVAPKPAVHNVIRNLTRNPDRADYIAKVKLIEKEFGDFPLLRSATGALGGSSWPGARSARRDRPITHGWSWRGSCHGQ